MNVEVVVLSSVKHECVMSVVDMSQPMYHPFPIHTSRNRTQACHAHSAERNVVYHCMIIVRLCKFARLSAMIFQSTYLYSSIVDICGKGTGGEVHEFGNLFRKS